MVAAAVFAVLITAISCFVAFGWDLYAAAKADDIVIPFSRLFNDTIELLKKGQVSYIKGIYEITYSMDSSGFYKDLGMSLLFCGLGIFGFIRSTSHKVRAKEQDGAQQ